MIQITSGKEDLLTKDKAHLVFQKRKLDSVSLIPKNYQDETKFNKKVIQYLLKIVDALPNTEIYVGDLSPVEFVNGGLTGYLFCFKNSAGKYVSIDKDEVREIKRMGFEVYKVS